MHFLHKEDAEAHDVLICIADKRMLIEENRRRYPIEHYFKTPEEMRALFADFPGACDATLEIAEKCNVEMVLDPTSSDKYPQFDSPDGGSREEYFHKVCFEGLATRYPDPILQELSDYLKHSTEEMQKSSMTDSITRLRSLTTWDLPPIS